jgi:hypothetical protein
MDLAMEKLRELLEGPEADYWLARLGTVEWSRQATGWLWSEVRGDLPYSSRPEFIRMAAGR